VTAARWALHPVTLALALLAGCVGAVAAGAVAAGAVATAPLLAVAVGLAAGFANSGST
jgi:hypothetical protein